MSALSALTSQAFQRPAASAFAPPAEGKALRDAAPARSGDAVSVSKTGLKLADRLSDRVSQLGHATIDVAQDFLGSFAQSLFGDAAKGAAISFDSLSLATSSSFSAQVSHSAGPDGGSDSASFDFSESSHFIGKGQITTADGQVFDFEIEVNYEASVSASASRTTTSAGDPGASAAPARALAPVDFPGTIDDLFKLLGREIHAKVPQPAQTEPGDQGGKLMLRLLKLVSSAELPQPGAAQSNANRLAAAYGSVAPDTATAAQVPAAA